MPTPSIPDPDFAAYTWQQSGENWQRASLKPLRDGRTLVLSGHGVQLRVDHGALVVRDGATHHPHEPQSWTLQRGIHGVQRIVIVNPTGSVTFDALKWCADQGVVVLALYDEDGDMYGFSTMGILSTSTADVALRRAQHQATVNGKDLSVAKWLIRHKLVGQIKVLERIADAPMETTRRKGSS